MTHFSLNSKNIKTRKHLNMFTFSKFSFLLAVAVLACILLPLTFGDVVDPATFRQEQHWEGAKDFVKIHFAKNGQMFATEKAGRIRLYESIESDVTDFVYVLDETYSETYTWWDKGMLGTAVHPDYPDTPLIWVFYSANRLPDQEVDINLFEKTSCPASYNDYCGTAAHFSRVRVDTATKRGRVEQVLVSGWCGASGSHHVGDLVWASDGGLYLSAGDGAAFDFADIGIESDKCYNPEDTRLQGSFRSQHDEYLLGKVLHVTPVSFNCHTVSFESCKILTPWITHRRRYLPIEGSLLVVTCESWPKVSEIHIALQFILRLVIFILAMWDPTSLKKSTSCRTP